MTFLHPGFFWGLWGLTIPVLIHLLGRRKPRVQLFPSLRLLRQTRQQKRSLSRLRSLLVMILRMLAIAAVVLALCNPVSDRRLFAALSPGRVTALVLIDTSASMQYRERGGDPTAAVFERARDAALQIVRRLPASAGILIGGAANGVALATEAPASRDAAEKALAAMRPGFARSVLPADLRQAAEILSRVDAEHGRVFLVTDNQATAWAGRVSLPEGLTRPPVWVVDVSAKEPRNVGITDAGPADQAPVPGRPFRYQAAFGQCGAPPSGDLTVTITPQGTPAFARNLTRFEKSTRLAFEADTPEGGVIDLPFDNLEPDNRWFVPGYRRTKLRLGIASGPGTDTKYLRAALGSIAKGPIATVAPSLGLPSPEKLDLLVLANVPAPEAAAVAACQGFAQAGGGVLVFGGDAAQPEAFSSGLLAALFGEGQLRLGKVASASGKPFGFGEIDTHRPPLAVFDSPKAGDLRAIGFRKAFQVEAATGVTVCARFDDDNPAIIGGYCGKGSVMFVNTSADTSWSDAPTKPVWVPLLHRLAFHTARRHDPLVPDGYSGEPVRIAVPPGCDGKLSITDGSGNSQALTTTEGAWAYTLGAPGRYAAHWTENGTAKASAFVVNVDPAEGDLTVDPKRGPESCQGLDASFISYEDLPERLRNSSLTRADLSVPLLILAALLLLAEAVLSLGARKREG